MSEVQLRSTAVSALSPVSFKGQAESNNRSCHSGAFGKLRDGERVRETDTYSGDIQLHVNIKVQDSGAQKKKKMKRATLVLIVKYTVIGF